MRATTKQKGKVKLKKYPGGGEVETSEDSKDKNGQKETAQQSPKEKVLKSPEQSLEQSPKQNFNSSYTNPDYYNSFTSTEELTQDDFPIPTFSENTAASEAYREELYSAREAYLKGNSKTKELAQQRYNELTSPEGMAKFGVSYAANLAKNTFLNPFSRTDANSSSKFNSPPKQAPAAPTPPEQQSYFNILVNAGPSALMDAVLKPSEPSTKGPFKYGVKSLSAKSNAYLQNKFNYGVQQLEVPNVPRGNAGEIAGSMVSGAMTGAKLGSMIPGVGNLIGAGAGALISGVGNLIAGGKRKKARRQAEMAQEINEGVLAQQSEFGNIQDMQPELYAEDGLKVGLPQRLIEIEGGEMVLEEVELTPSEGKTKKMFRLKREFPKGRKHSEGGINYVAAQGDVIIPANMRDKVKQALDGRDNLLIEQYVSKLPTDGEYAKKGYRMGAKKLYGKGGEVSKYPTGGMVDFMVDQGFGNQNKLAAGFGKDPFSGTKTALEGIKPEGFDLGSAINLGGNLLAPILNATAKGPQLPQAPRLAAVPNIEVTDATPEMNAIAREMNFRTQQQANQLSTGQARQARFNLANRALADTTRQNRLNQVIRQDQATNQERQMRFNRDNQQAALYDQRAMQQLAADREAQAVRRQGLGDIGRTFALNERDRQLREDQLRKEGTLQSIYELYSPYAQFNPKDGVVNLMRFNSPNEF